MWLGAATRPPPSSTAGSDRSLAAPELVRAPTVRSERACRLPGSLIAGASVAQRSPASAEASGVPSALAVDVTLVVTPPATTPAGASVYMAGNQPEICNWCNQHTTKLTKGDDGKWRITITWPEGTSVEYKYTLGDWDHVEKGASCDEIANRKFTVQPGGDEATMTVEETVKNWRNVAPCGN